MPGGRRGLVAPQNTFLENIIRRSNSQRKYKLFVYACLLILEPEVSKKKKNCYAMNIYVQNHFRALS